eukprot:5519633-Pleurochrysis_carterae.AAC.1
MQSGTRRQGRRHEAQRHGRGRVGRASGKEGAHTRRHAATGGEQGVGTSRALRAREALALQRALRARAAGTQNAGCEGRGDYRRGALGRARRVPSAATDWHNRGPA